MIPFIFNGELATWASDRCRIVDMSSEANQATKVQKRLCKWEANFASDNQLDIIKWCVWKRNCRQSQWPFTYCKTQGKRLPGCFLLHSKVLESIVSAVAKQS